MRRFYVLLAMLAVTMARPAFAYDVKLSFTGNILPPSCTVSSATANQTIDLGSAPVSNFTSVGTTLNATPFTVSLTNCSVGTNVAMTVSGTASTVPSVLQSTGTASQVGVQLLQGGGNSINLNSAITLGVVDSSQAMTVPFIAQFYQLGTSVTAGTVIATATVNFTYN